MNNIRKIAIQGIKWTGLSFSFKSAIQLFQIIILAKILEHNELGIMSILLVIIGFSTIFSDMGISNAIIHKKDISRNELSSLFIFNIFMGIFIFIIIYLSSDLIGLFFNEHILGSLIKIISFIFFINSFGNQYKSLLKKNLNFSIISKIEIFSELLSFMLLLILLYNDFGISSVVYSLLLNSLIVNILLILFGMKFFQFKLHFKFLEIVYFLKFGLYQLGQNLTIYFNSQFDILLIGKIFGSEILGVYSIIKQLVLKPSQIINSTTMSVFFPIMSKLQDEINRLKEVYLKLLTYLCFINFPIYFILILFSEAILYFILGEKWQNHFFLMQILSLYALLRSTTSPAGSLVLSVGKANLGFYWTLGELLVMPLFIYLGSFWGIIGVSFSLLFLQIVMILINWRIIIKRIIHVDFKEYFNTHLLSFIISFLICIIFFLLSFESLVFVPVYIFIYICISLISNKKVIYDLKEIFLKKGLI